MVTVIVAIMVGRGCDRTQGEQADTQTDQGAGIIMAMPAAAITIAAVTEGLAEAAVAPSMDRASAVQIRRFMALVLS